VGYINECGHHLYADDLQIYKTIKPSDTVNAVDRINEDLERVAEWSDTNGLVLNPDKTKYIVRC
jgi:hypothetical protein